MPFTRAPNCATGPRNFIVRGVLGPINGSTRPVDGDLTPEDTFVVRRCIDIHERTLVFDRYLHSIVKVRTDNRLAPIAGSAPRSAPNTVRSKSTGCPC